MNWVRSKLQSAWAFIKARMPEHSTIVAIAAVLTPASALPKPWCYYYLIVGVVGVLIPDGTFTKPPADGTND